MGFFQELGGTNLDKCKGFSENLMELVEKRWEQMASASKHLHNLRRVLGKLQQLPDEAEYEEDPFESMNMDIPLENDDLLIEQAHAGEKSVSFYFYCHFRSS